MDFALLFIIYRFCLFQKSSYAHFLRVLVFHILFWLFPTLYYQLQIVWNDCFGMRLLLTGLKICNRFEQKQPIQTC